MFDIDGLLEPSRKNLFDFQKPYAHPHAPRGCPAGAKGFVAGRFFSLVHSIGRYMITLPGRKSAAADPQGGQSSIQSGVPRPT